MGWCQICDAEVVKSHLHHVIPRAYGGESGPTVELCSNHHNMIHDIATAIIYGRTDDVLNRGRWRNPDERGRALRLVEAIVRAQRSRGSQQYKVTLTLDQESRKILERLKEELGARSLSSAIEQCIAFVSTAKGIR